MIDNNRKKILKELISFSKEHFGERDYFICIYGSFISTYYNKTSDIDMFIATNSYSDEDFKSIKKFLIDLHIRNNLKLDDEVPYKNKLIVLYDDIHNAILLKQFIRSGRKYYVPPIEKREKFLSSPEVRWRLLFNALTSPHKYLCGNKDKYLIFKKNAEKSIMKLAHGLVETKKLNHDELLKNLLVRSSGEEGGMYLGYKKERDDVIKYLKKIIKQNYL
ncbi:MAG: nucleotidyltransferase domain-containing protein [Patescibacteria group bacterium]